MQQGVKHNIKKNTDFYSIVTAAAVQLQRKGDDCYSRVSTAAV